MTPAQRAIFEAIARAHLRGVGRVHLRSEAARELGIAHNTITEQLRRLCKDLGADDWWEVFQHWHARQDMSQEGLGRRWTAPTALTAKLDQAETLIRDVLLDPRLSNTMAQPKLLKCLDALELAREAVRKSTPTR